MLNAQPYSPTFFNPEKVPINTPVDSELNNYYAIMGSILGIGSLAIIIIVVLFLKKINFFNLYSQDKVSKATAPTV